MTSSKLKEMFDLLTCPGNRHHDRFAVTLQVSIGRTYNRDGEFVSETTNYHEGGAMERDLADKSLWMCAHCNVPLEVIS